MTLFKKTMLATALAATALAGSAPAMADGYRGGYHHGGDGAGLAIGAGILGLAVGALVASNSHHDDRYDRAYPDNGYYPDGGYYAAPYAQPHWVWHDGYYWDHDGNRYGRDGRFYGQYRPDRNWHDRDWHDGDRYDGYRGY